VCVDGEGIEREICLDELFLYGFAKKGFKENRTDIGALCHANLADIMNTSESEGNQSTSHEWSPIVITANIFLVFPSN